MVEDSRQREAGESNGYSGSKVSQRDGIKGRKWRQGPVRKLLKEP